MIPGTRFLALVGLLTIATPTLFYCPLSAMQFFGQAAEQQTGGQGALTLLREYPKTAAVVGLGAAVLGWKMMQNTPHPATPKEILKRAIEEKDYDALKAVLAEHPMLINDQLDNEAQIFPLHYAVGQLEPDFGIVMELLKAGASRLVRNKNGQTPAHYLLVTYLVNTSTESEIAQGATDIAEILDLLLITMERAHWGPAFTKEQLNLQDNAGNTLLHYAVQTHRFLFTNFMFNHGSGLDRGIKNNDGQTYLELVQSRAATQPFFSTILWQLENPEPVACSNRLLRYTSITPNGHHIC